MRADLVHLPRIFVQTELRLPAATRLAFFNQFVQQMAESRKTSLHRRSAGECGSPVSAETPFTDALKISFDHCAGRASCKRLGFESAGDDQVGGFFHYSEWRARRLKRAHPGGVSSSILHMRVAVLRAAHESGAADDVAARVCAAMISSLPKTVLRGEDGPLIEAAADQREIDSLTCVALVATMPRSQSGKSFGLRRGFQRDRETHAFP